MSWKTQRYKQTKWNTDLIPSVWCCLPRTIVKAPRGEDGSRGTLANEPRSTGIWQTAWAFGKAPR